MRGLLIFYKIGNINKKFKSNLFVTLFYQKFITAGAHFLKIA